MAVTVRIPTPMRKLAGDAKAVLASGASIGAVVADMDRQFPGFKDRLCEDDGSLRRFVNFYLNGEDIRYANGVETSVKDGDEISIIPAVSGG